MWKLQKEIIKRFNPDILHAHFIDQVALITQWLSIPYVITPWGSDVYFPFPDRFKGINRLLKWVLLRRAYRKAGAVTALSPYMAKILKERFGASSENTILLGFGTPTVRTITEEERTIARQIRRADDKTLVFFSPRACRPLYNTKQMVQGFIEALSDIGHVQLWVSEFNADKEYLTEIKRHVEKRGRSNEIMFLPPDIPEDLHARLFASDIIVSVPDSDGMPVSILQALSQGRPLLYKKIPQLEGFIEDGIHGFTIHDVTPESVKLMIKKIYENRDKLNEMGRNCKEYFDSLPTEQSEMDRMCEIYKKLYERKQR
jgi:glycosyltransferase involved in cell wall biosynthesis